MNYGIFFCQKVTCAKRGKTIIKYICVCVISLPVSLDQQVACVLFLLFGGFTGIMFVYYAYICNTWVHSEAAIFTYMEPFDDKRTSSRTRTHRHTHTHIQAQLNGRPQEKQQRQQQTANGKWQPKRKPKTAANNCAATRLRQQRELGRGENESGQWEEER